MGFPNVPKKGHYKEMEVGIRDGRKVGSGGDGRKEGEG